MKTLNYRTRLIDLAGEVNSEMPHFVADKVQDALNGRRRPVNGSRVMILGVAYKRDVDDVRESPALDVMQLLGDKGADVVYHDPHVPELHEDARVHRSVPFTQAELEKCDCVVIITDHSAVDYSRLRELDCPIVDTRNVLSGWDSSQVIGLSGQSRPIVKEATPGAVV
jgi:UDP-N-acetyl-D-glucosamine dehydrogenase